MFNVFVKKIDTMFMIHIANTSSAKFSLCLTDISNKGIYFAVNLSKGVLRAVGLCIVKNKDHDCGICECMQNHNMARLIMDIYYTCLQCN